ncbi:NYN domain-containing protein [Melaminivora suipulveris]|nr:NYN domain-containing protein [Melaminivora suipulveris]
MAVFIDADNLSDPTALDHVLIDLRKRADRVLYKRAYGRAESLKAIESVLWRHGVRPVANMIVNKVTTDSALVIDAVEAVCSNKIDAVAICSGDADFVPLATWLREKGCQVWCFSLADRIFANPDSFYDDVVLLELVDPSADQPGPAKDGGAAEAMQCMTPSSPAIGFVLPSGAPDTVQRVLQAFPGLLTGQPQHLNQVVTAMRSQGVIGKTTKVVSWFQAYCPHAFQLFPQRAPNRIVYGPLPSVEPTAQLAATRLDGSVMDRLLQAVRLAQGQDGWSSVSAVRMQLGSKTEFDTRAHGCKTLTQLLAISCAFELRAAGTPQVAVRCLRLAT